MTTPHLPSVLRNPDMQHFYLMVWCLGYARVHPKWNNPSYWASLPEEDV